MPGVSTVGRGVEVDLGRGEVGRDGISGEEDCVLNGGEASEIVSYGERTSLGDSPLHSHRWLQACGIRRVGIADRYC